MSYNLYCYCPACKIKDQPNGPSYWKHTACNCTSTIDKQAKVGCKGNGEHCKAMNFVKWKWKCNNHNNEAKSVNVLYATAQYVVASRAIAKAAAGYPQGVFAEICDALADQCILYYYIYMTLYVFYLFKIINKKIVEDL